MKRFRGKKRLILLIVSAALVLSLTSLLYKRTESCEKVTNPSAGATLCEAYGPRTYRGFPFGVTYETSDYIEAMTQDGIYVKTRYWPVLFNTLFYAMWIVIVLYLVKTLKPHNEDKHNNIDVK